MVWCPPFEAMALRNQPRGVPFWSSACVKYDQVVASVQCVSRKIILMNIDGLFACQVEDQEP